MQDAEFSELMAIAAESQGWRPLSDALKDLWLQTSRRLPDEQVIQLAMSFAETPGQKPADFFKELKATVRRHLAETTITAKVEPTPNCDEAIRARRAIAVALSVKREGCPYGGCKVAKVGPVHCYCFAEAWAEPIATDERGQPAANPVAAVFGTPAPDPKKHDHVWREAA